MKFNDIETINSFNLFKCNNNLSYVLIISIYYILNSVNYDQFYEMKKNIEFLYSIMLNLVDSSGFDMKQLNIYI